jgi:transposase
MGRTHTPYPPEFRRQLVELVRAGRSPTDLAREFEPSAEAIRNWVKQAERDVGRRTDGGLPSDERDELARLRREVRQLRQERDILAKAAAWFARETGTIPSGSSNS